MATYVVLNATTPQITFTLADPYMIFGCITVCLGWLHTVYSMKEPWDFSSHSKDKNKKPTEKNGGGGVLIAAKYQGIMGLSRSPATQSWIKLIIWAGVLGGPAGEGRVLFHKVRCLPAMQYSTEHNLQPSLHTEGHVSFPEPQKKKKASAKRASIWNARTVLLKCRSNKDEWGEEISSCRWMQII